MKKFTFFLLWFCLIAPAYGQITFNHQLNLDFPFKVLTSVLPTDSCYYATGIVTDTTGGTYKIGNIFVKFNLEGEVEYLKLLAAPGKFYETWFGDLIRTGDGGFVDFQLRGTTLPKGAQFRIVDIAGKTMKAFKAGNLADTYMVSVGSWPGGVYFLQYLMDEKVLRSKKFIKH